MMDLVFLLIGFIFLFTLVVLLLVFVSENPKKRKKFLVIIPTINIFFMSYVLMEIIERLKYPDFLDKLNSPLISSILIFYILMSIFSLIYILGKSFKKK